MSTIALLTPLVELLASLKRKLDSLESAVDNAGCAVDTVLDEWQDDETPTSMDLNLNIAAEGNEGNILAYEYLARCVVLPCVLVCARVTRHSLLCHAEL